MDEGARFAPFCDRRLNIMMYLSAFLTCLPLDFAAGLKALARLGFTHVDLTAKAARPDGEREALAESGLVVSCMAVGRGLSEGCALDAVELADRKTALEEMKRQVVDAAQLGATAAYIVPGSDASPAGLERFAEAARLLASYAYGRGVRLCVEHVPGRALPTVARTLDWLRGTGQECLDLLLDLGHCLISEEDPVLAVVKAGERLGYVHLDDNDSLSDLHWPLCTGRLTHDMLDAFFAILNGSNYRGGCALEYNPGNPEPQKALRDGRVLFERMAKIG